MSPMLDIQRRHAELFRIRMGEKQGNRPVKLTDAIRITARNKGVVEAFAAVYGGDPQPWQDQWEVKIPTTELNVLVLPGQSVDQHWEFYKGSVNVRRCDGYQEQKSGKRCMCPEDITERMGDKKACSPMTRLNVLCPDVKVVGAGALVTHGLIAAQTLPQSVMVAERALAQGFMVPAVLRVEEVKGRTHFVVPRLEIVGLSFGELTGGDGVAGELVHATGTPVADLELAEGGPAAIEAQAGFTPAGLDPTPAPSVAAQVASKTAKRKTSKEAVPATGLRPRTAQQAAAGERAPAAPAPWQMTDKQRAGLMASLSEARVDDVMRGHLVGLVTSGRTTSSRDLTRIDYDVLLFIAKTLGDEDLPDDRKMVIEYDPDGSLLLQKAGGNAVDVAAIRRHMEQRVA